MKINVYKDKQTYNHPKSKQNAIHVHFHVTRCHILLASSSSAGPSTPQPMSSVYAPSVTRCHTLLASSFPAGPSTPQRMFLWLS
eukprot:g64678.t1